MVDRSHIAEDWSRRGYSCGEFIDPPGRRWEDFTHDVDELFVVMEGRMELEIEGAVTHPAIGEEVFIPARAVHSVRNIGDATARWLYGYKR